MAKLVWGSSPKEYETGIDRGVFYPKDGPAEVWNGLTSVQESPSEVDTRARYLDGRRLGQHGRRGEYTATLEAFTYPDSFESTFLNPKKKVSFGLSYRVMTATGYKIHLIYNAIATPLNRAYSYQSAAPFSWELTTRGEKLDGVESVAHLVIDSSIAYSSTLEALETALYGSNEVTPHLPSPASVLDIFEENSILRIIDHGDGTWTAIGPDDVITMLDATTFKINYSTAVYVDANTYTIHSL